MDWKGAALQFQRNWKGTPDFPLKRTMLAVTGYTEALTYRVQKVVYKGFRYNHGAMPVMIPISSYLVCGSTCYSAAIHPKDGWGPTILGQQHSIHQRTTPFLVADFNSL
jgi:hypothetical protein